MQAIEFEAMASHHTLRVPDNVPDGVKMRVLLLIEDSKNKLHASDLKSLLATITEGLSTDDLLRQADLGREDPEWHS